MTGNLRLHYEVFVHRKTSVVTNRTYVIITENDSWYESAWTGIETSPLERQRRLLTTRPPRLQYQRQRIKKREIILTRYQFGVAFSKRIFVRQSNRIETGAPPSPSYQTSYISAQVLIDIGLAKKHYIVLSLIASYTASLRKLLSRDENCEMHKIIQQNFLRTNAYHK